MSVPVYDPQISIVLRKNIGRGGDWIQEPYKSTAATRPMFLRSTMLICGS